MLGFLGRWAGSKGMVKVPNLIGLSKQEAIDALTAAGLINSVNTETETSNSSLHGKAHQQSKNADELVDYETEIEFSHYKYVAAPVAPVAAPTAPYAAPQAPSPTPAPAPAPSAPPPTTGTVYMTYCYSGSAYSDTFTVDENNIIVQNISEACAAYSSLFANLGATDFRCSTSSMPALPTNCEPAPTAPVPAPTAPVAPTEVWYCTLRDADCGVVYYETDQNEANYDPCIRCSKTSYPTAAGCSGCGTVPVAPTAPTAPSPTPTAPTAPVAPTWYCTTSVQCGGVGNCSYSTSSSNVSASGSGYSTQCLTSGYGSCQSTTCTSVPTAPVSSPTAPTAPVAAPTAPVAAPTAPVAAPTAPVAAPTAPVAAPTAPVFGGCIFGETLISTVDENNNTLLIPAQDIQVGTRVWGATFDESVDESIINPYAWSSETITNMQRVATLIANVTVKTVSATMTINNDIAKKFSLEQGIFTKRDGIYTYRTTADLIVGDTILTFNENLGIFVETPVESIEIDNNPAVVYKFDAEPTDTLIAGNILVHNRKVY